MSKASAAPSTARQVLVCNAGGQQPAGDPRDWEGNINQRRAARQTEWKAGCMATRQNVHGETLLQSRAIGVRQMLAVEQHALVKCCQPLHDVCNRADSGVQLDQQTWAEQDRPVER